MKDMKKVMIIVVLGAVMAYMIPAYAQTFQPTPEKAAMQSQQMINSGVQYKSTIYEPFNNTMPSEQSEAGASNSPAKAPGGPRRGFDIGGDAGQGPSPIGDAVVPLLLCAAAFAGMVALRRRRSAVK